MRKLLLCLIAGVVFGLLNQTNHAQAGERQSRKHTRGDRVAARFAQTRPWNGPYYHTQYGRPVVLLVPPTAHTQTQYSWGAAYSTVTPIYHQFQRNYPGAQYQYQGVPLRATPVWPNHTGQFGVYPVRGPW